MDEVIADFTPKFIKHFNRHYNENISIEDLKGKRLNELRPDLRKEMMVYIQEPSFFRDLGVMKIVKK